MGQHPGSKGSTFIVRIWLEWSAIHPCWRGQIEHVESGQKSAFLNLKEMRMFIQSLVSMPAGNNHSRKGEEVGKEDT